MAEQNYNIDLTFNTNASEVTNDVKNLTNATNNISDSQQNATKASNSYSNSLKSNSVAVLENGGAMGLLNDLTGGYAMMVKDAVEASALFLKAKKTEVVVTEIQTAATTQAAVATEVQTVATGKASIATSIWNAILALNPIGAVVAGVIALTAVLGYLAIAFYNNKKAVEAINDELSTNKLRQEASNKATEEATRTTTGLNQLEIARAKALGKSSKEIDLMILRQKELAEATAFTNAKTARQAQILAQNSLRNANIVGDEDAIKVAEEQLKTATDTYKKFNQEYDSAIIETGIQRLTLQENNRKAQEDNTKKANDKAEENAKKAKADRDKKLEEEKKYNNQLIKDKIEFDKIITQSNIDSKIESDRLLEEKLNNASREADAIEQGNENLKTAYENLTQIKLDNSYNEIENEKIAYDEKRNLLAEQLEFINTAEFESEEARTEAKRQNAEARKQIDIAEVDAKLATLGAISSALTSFTSELGEQTAAGKAFAVAAATIDTYAAIAGTLKAFSGVPVPGYAIAQSIAIGIAGLLNVKKILSVKVPSGTGTGSAGSAPSIGAVASTAPTTSFVSSSNNQLAQTIGGQTQQQTQSLQQQPIKAYVVTKDITTAQQLDRNAISSTTIG